MLLNIEQSNVGGKGKDREPLNIVILGASFAGLAVAHKLMREILERLGITRGAHRYKVILIGPSTHLYWNIGAPRAIVDKKRLPLDDIFVSFEPLFEEYPKTRFEFI
jgi:NADH dehydrogenase FAD-containing subunit